MPMVETLGVLAHRGGLVLERPELSVGIVRAVSRPTGLEVELIARRPLDRRTAAERQADIRASRSPVSPAPRRLLPAYDEGIDLRVGWLDAAGRAHWEFGSRSSGSGDHWAGEHGPSWHDVLSLPPSFDHLSLVLAWPEIGFPETVVPLPLPDRATVDRGTVSIWDVPVHARPAPRPLRYRPFAADEPPVEAGRIVAGPRVLARGAEAAVVLTRATAIGALLGLEVVSIAFDATAAAADEAFRPMDGPPAMPGATVAVLLPDGEALHPAWHEGSSSGGVTDFQATAAFSVPAPTFGPLTLLVAWPEASLDEVCAEIPLDRP